MYCIAIKGLTLPDLSIYDTCMESVQPPRSDDNDFTLYLETEAARYELGSVIRGGMTLQKAPREIADEVIAHLKYGFEK